MNAPTYAELMQSGAARLRAAGLDEPLREARRLMMLASESSPGLLIALESDTVPEDQIEAFDLMVTMRGERTPYAHIAGEVEFYGLLLRTDSRALIPRPDSEVVIDVALELIPSNTPVQIADLGTGSGALLCAILMNRTRTTGTAVEASRGAIMLAAENIKALDISSRVQLFSGSWAEWTGWDACDLIISNPPYIRRDVIATLEPEVREFDPSQALDGGVDGLDAYREIIALAAAQMKAGAHLVLEIGFDQKQTVSDLLIKAGFADLRHRQDLGGNDRAIAATKT